MNKKIKIIIISFISIILICLFLLYGPWSKLRNFWITSAMTTKEHHFLAKMFYSEDQIDKVLSFNRVDEVRDVSDPNLIHIGKKTSILKNKYEKQILDQNKKDVYKIIPIKGNTFRGSLVAIYDPSRVHLITSKYLGESGQTIKEISKENDVLVAMNAGGYFDPGWTSNGAIPHGTVIVDGNIVSEFDDAGVGGGFIGFTTDDKLILGNMSVEEALDIGYRDAIEFGPFLIINGERSRIEGNGGWGIAPRTVIGQRRDGIVLFLVIDGRLPTSIGADMRDLMDIMEKYGAVNATNLDGGSSSALLVNNKVINHPVGGGKDGLRSMPTFWIVK